MAHVRRSFAVSGCLGRGGFGEVYRARMTGSSGISNDVALKVLLRGGADGQAARRMRDEGKLLARLDHPAIVKVHDLVVLEGRLALVTELVDGQDLAACLHPSGPGVPFRVLLEIVARTAEALDAAWNAPVGEDRRPLRLVHRDVKPSNIFVSRHGDVRLLDFGLATTDEVTREARTMAELLVGSPAYMAPERFLVAEVHAASDVFSLGATLFEGLAGRRLFDLPVTMAASLAVSQARYEAFVREQLADLREVDVVTTLLRDLLAFAPERRPAPAEVAQRCDDLASRFGGPGLGRWSRERSWPPAPDLAGELCGRTIEEDLPHRPTEAPPRPVPARTLGRWVAGASVALGVLVVGTAVLAGGAGLWWIRVPAGAPPASPVAATARLVPAAGMVSPPSAVVDAEEPPLTNASSQPRPRPLERPRTDVQAPAPVPVAPEPATVAIEAVGAEVSVLGPGGVPMAVPGTVPAGSYEVLVRFADGGTERHPLLAVPGGHHRVKANGRMHSSSVE